MKSEISSKQIPNQRYRYTDGVFTPTLFEDGMVSLLQQELDPCEDPKIKVVSFIDFKKESATYPLIVCAIGDIQIDLLQSGMNTSGFGLNAYPNSEDNKIRHVVSTGSTFNIRCVCGTAREAREVSYDLFTTVCGLAYFIPEMFGVSSFKVLGMMLPKKMETEPNEHLWFADIACSLKTELMLATERVAPRLKSFGIGLNTTVL